MIPPILKIILWIGLAAILIYLGLLILPAIIASIPLIIAIKNKHPAFTARGAAYGVKALNAGAIKAVAVIAVPAVVIGYGTTIAATSLLSVARGENMAGASIVFLFLAGIVGATIWLFSKILKGDYMKDIFSIVSDPGQMDAFLSGDQAPIIVHIDSDKLIHGMRSDVIGQDQILDDVGTTLARRAKLRRKGKPLAVFMFVGATGSGKTELAKSIAKHAFEGRLARYDMNEFTVEHSTQRLIGAPPGYIGSDKGGHLTQEIKRMRSGVILFDEIEKAHPDVFKLIMGLMDEGRITEQSTGQTMDASKFCIVLTSNAEHEKLAALVKTISDLDERKRAVKDTLQIVFKPEQLARIDEIFCFGQLDRRALAQVIGKFLFGFAKDAGVELQSVDADLLINTITRHEKQADYGIRELIRLVESTVLDGMLEARAEGFQAVAIDVDPMGIRVRGVPLAGARA